MKHVITGFVLFLAICAALLAVFCFLSACSHKRAGVSSTRVPQFRNPGADLVAPLNLAIR